MAAVRNSPKTSKKKSPPKIIPAKKLPKLDVEVEEPDIAPVNSKP